MDGVVAGLGQDFGVSGKVSEKLACALAVGKGPTFCAVIAASAVTRFPRMTDTCDAVAS